MSFPLRPAPTLRLAWLAVPLSLLAAAAWAGPKEDMQALSLKFLALRSYHVTMESSDARMPKMQMDFVAPNRYRMQMPMGTQYVIGDTMYMSVNGRTMKVPMNKGTVSGWRDSDRVFRNLDQTRVEALGTELLNGRPTKKYRMTQSGMTQSGKTPGTSLVWVGGDGYPVQVETTGTARGKNTTMTIHYSRFNDPAIRIDPPK